MMDRYTLHARHRASRGEVIAFSDGTTTALVSFDTEGTGSVDGDTTVGEPVAALVRSFDPRAAMYRVTPLPGTERTPPPAKPKPPAKPPATAPAKPPAKPPTRRPTTKTPASAPKGPRR